jgi:polyisoprenoid-binding protein YceI
MATFTFDPAHSSVDFSVRHMVFSRVKGSFRRFTVTLDVDDATNVPTSITAVIDADSIDTGVGDRDNHLKSADFLSAQEHAQLQFTSTKVTGSADHFTVEGNLTIHGVSKPVTVLGEVDGRGKDPWGNDRISFSAKTKINRKDFGLTWNQALETGGLMVGEEIDISMTIQAVKAQATAAV